ncbi:MAG: AIR synthase related protein, partial [Pseudomonadota bacterium]
RMVGRGDQGAETFNGVKAELPLKALSGSAPEYDRPWEQSTAPAPLKDEIEIDPIEGLRALITSPNHASKAWVYEQYDSQVLADTVLPPGAAAGLVRVHGTEKYLAFTSDVTPRYVAADPIEGGKQAVAETYRNLSAVGALPLATTDNLNFGNPEKPEIMGQFVGAIQGIGEACRALDTPIVSGNVSLYNETDGSGILPTPTIGAVGLIRAGEAPITGHAQEGDCAILIGDMGSHLGQSALLECAFGRAEGTPPDVDLETEKRNGTFLRDHRDWVHAATDLSDGGLALAAFEMAVQAGLGVTLHSGDTSELFGEDQARYLVACPFDWAEDLMVIAGRAGVPVSMVGTFGGDEVRMGRSGLPLETLQGLFATSFEDALS